jgi:hypothetical protein
MESTLPARNPSSPLIQRKKLTVGDPTIELVGGT